MTPRVYADVLRYRMHTAKRTLQRTAHIQRTAAASHVHQINGLYMQGQEVGFVASVGKPQCPSSMASVSA